MNIKWTHKALSDLVRLHDFLAPVNKQVAARVVQSLTSAPDRLLEHPQIGEKLEGFEAREVRRLWVGHYEMRYEIQGSFIYLLRIWHSRENRILTSKLPAREEVVS